MQHSPRTVLLPSPATSNNPLPETVHLLYSPTSSVILHINPSSSQRLSISELSNAAFPPPRDNGRPLDHTHTNTFNASDNAPEKSGVGGLGMGMGALSGLGGYVGLGGKAAIPLGTRTVGGEVVIVRDGERFDRKWECSDHVQIWEYSTLLKAISPGRNRCIGQTHLKQLASPCPFIKHIAYLDSLQSPVHLFCRSPIACCGRNVYSTDPFVAGSPLTYAVSAGSHQSPCTSCRHRHRISPIAYTRGIIDTCRVDLCCTQGAFRFHS